MVWGAFSAAGTGELLHCKTFINALEYRIILQKGLLPTIEKLFSKEKLSNVIFQQDNSPAHTANNTKTWLENQVHQAHVLARSESRLEPYRDLTGKHFSTTHQLFKPSTLIGPFDSSENSW